MLLPTIIFFLVPWSSAAVVPATYDQRQTGDVNVQIHLKDVQVVALLDSELFGDYEDVNYDYADFTIKPLVKPTTSSGSTTTTASPWYTWPTNPPKSSKNPEEVPSTASDSSSSPSADSSSTPSADINSTRPTVLSSTEATNDFIAVDRLQSRNKAAPISQCQSGYFKDSKGRCKKGLRKRFSLIPFVMRMLPQRPLTQPLTKVQQ